MGVRESSSHEVRTQYGCRRANTHQYSSATSIVRGFSIEMLGFSDVLWLLLINVNTSHSVRWGHTTERVWM